MNATPVAMTPPEPAEPAARLWRPSPRLTGWLFGVLTLLSAAAIVAFAVRTAGPEQVTAGRPTAKARKGEFLVILSCRGELVADKSVVITAPTKVPDLRITWMAEPGAAVKPGDVIVKFDESSARRQLQEKEAALNQSQASLDQAIAEARINEQKDDLEIADARTAVETARLSVAKADIVSAIQADEYRLELRLAEEKLRVKQAGARLNRASGQSKIASFETQRDKNKAELDITADRIKRMIVTAPSAGIVSFVMNYSRGWINAAPFRVGDSVWGGSEIAEIPDISTLQLKAKVEEMDRSRMTPGQAVRIVLDPFPEKPYPGKLARLSPLVEQNFEWPPSRNFRGFADFDQVEARLRPGMNGRMDVIVDHIPDAISVPAKAVFTHNGNPVVLVPAGDRLRPVEVGVVARNPDEVAVRGIKEGDTVALVDELADGKGGRKQ